MTSAIRKARGFLTVALLGTVFCSLSAQASTVLFNTLGPNNEYNWDYAQMIGQLPFSGVQQVLAMPFTLGDNATVADAVLALGSFAGDSNLVSVYIESDSGGLPGSIVSALSPDGGLAPPSDSSGGGLVVYSCSSACALDAGSYWLVASKPGSSGWDWDYWYNSYENQALGVIAVNSDGNPDGPWTGVYTGLAGYRIDGAASIPEPASFVLLGSGLFGVIAWALGRRTR